MTIKLTSAKARILATTVAVSILALATSANAQVAAGALNGKYKKGTWALTKEAKGATNDLRTDAQKLADAITLAQKAQVKALVFEAAQPATVNAYNLYLSTGEEAFDAAGVLKAKQTLLATEQAKKVKAEAALAALTISKNTAEDALDAANNAVDDAQEALDDMNADDNTDAEIAAATRAVAVATIKRDLAQEAFDQVGTAFDLTEASLEAEGGILDKIDGYEQDVDDADDVLRLATRAAANAQDDLEDALSDDEDFAAKLAVINASAGTAITASIAGLEAADALDVPVPLATFASNGFARATAILGSSAASTNSNISMASGALTGSAAAIDVGANFETEVLGALVDHETRITSNTTAIAALDVRTTANTTAIATNAAGIAANKTAIAALDVRTTANTTAIANEVTARIAADNALGGRITAEENARKAADNLLSDQIASSTATAIAMGGAALLPDMGFTLSGNVAFYEGAQAMALNAAAKVGANAYVTAAVGGGLNKNGSVGGRVGFVFGF